MKEALEQARKALASINSLYSSSGRVSQLTAEEVHNEYNLKMPQFSPEHFDSSMRVPTSTTECSSPYDSPRVCFCCRKKEKPKRKEPSFEIERYYEKFKQTDMPLALSSSMVEYRESLKRHRSQQQLQPNQN